MRNSDGGAVRARKPYTITKAREKWTPEEHDRFIEAIKMFGRSWKKIEEHIGTKTAVQVRSHAQKFFNKLERKKEMGEELAHEEVVTIPPPRPKRKPHLPYPKKGQDSAYTATTTTVIDAAGLSCASLGTICLPHRGPVSFAGIPSAAGAVSPLIAAALPLCGAPLCAALPLAARAAASGDAGATTATTALAAAEDDDAGGSISEATIAAVVAAASAAAAAAAAAVVSAAGSRVQAYLQAHPPPGFPFFGVPPTHLNAFQGSPALPLLLSAATGGAGPPVSAPGSSGGSPVAAALAAGGGNGSDGSDSLMVDCGEDDDGAADAQAPGRNADAGACCDDAGRADEDEEEDEEEDDDEQEEEEGDGEGDDRNGTQRGGSVGDSACSRETDAVAAPGAAAAAERAAAELRALVAGAAGAGASAYASGLSAAAALAAGGSGAAAAAAAAGGGAYGNWGSWGLALQQWMVFNQHTSLGALFGGIPNPAAAADAAAGLPPAVQAATASDGKRSARAGSKRSHEQGGHGADREPPAKRPSGRVHAASQPEGTATNDDDGREEPGPETAGRQQQQQQQQEEEEEEATYGAAAPASPALHDALADANAPSDPSAPDSGGGGGNSSGSNASGGSGAAGGRRRGPSAGGAGGSAEGEPAASDGSGRGARRAGCGGGTAEGLAPAGNQYASASNTMWASNGNGNGSGSGSGGNGSGNDRSCNGNGHGHGHSGTGHWNGGHYHSYGSNNGTSRLQAEPNAAAPGFANPRTHPQLHDSRGHHAGGGNGTGRGGCGGGGNDGSHACCNLYPPHAASPGNGNGGGQMDGAPPFEASPASCRPEPRAGSGPTPPVQQLLPSGIMSPPQHNPQQAAAPVCWRVPPVPSSFPAVAACRHSAFGPYSPEAAECGAAAAAGAADEVGAADLAPAGRAAMAAPPGHKGQRRGTPPRPDAQQHGSRPTASLDSLAAAAAAVATEERGRR